METLRYQVQIPENHSIRLVVRVPDCVPAGNAEVLVVVSSLPAHAMPQDIAQFAGTLTLSEDPLAYQRRIRSEWE